MKNLFLFCMGGIIYTLNEDGRDLSSSALYGFTKEPRDSQMKFIKNTFIEFETRFSKEYKVIFVKSPEEKQNLKEAIHKKIAYEKENYQNDNWKYWERYLTEIDTPSFSYYNEDILR